MSNLFITAEEIRRCDQPNFRIQPCKNLSLWKKGMLFSLNQ
jgi:hypothetical protein